MDWRTDFKLKHTKLEYGISFHFTLNKMSAKG